MLDRVKDKAHEKYDAAMVLWSTSAIKFGIAFISARLATNYYIDPLSTSLPLKVLAGASAGMIPVAQIQLLNPWNTDSPQTSLAIMNGAAAVGMMTALLPAMK